MTRKEKPRNELDDLVYALCKLPRIEMHGVHIQSQDNGLKNPSCQNRYGEWKCLQLVTFVMNLPYTSRKALGGMSRYKPSCFDVIFLVHLQQSVDTDGGSEDTS
jgi:hypothetical protein